MSITFYITLLQQIRCYNMLLMAKNKYSGYLTPSICYEKYCECCTSQKRKRTKRIVIHKKIHNIFHNS